MHATTCKNATQECGAIMQPIPMITKRHSYPLEQLLIPTSFSNELAPVATYQPGLQPALRPAARAIRFPMLVMSTIGSHDMLQAGTRTIFWTVNEWTCGIFPCCLEPVCDIMRTAETQIRFTTGVARNKLYILFYLKSVINQRQGTQQSW